MPPGKLNMVLVTFDVNGYEKDAFMPFWMTGATGISALDTGLTSLLL